MVQEDESVLLQQAVVLNQKISLLLNPRNHYPLHDMWKIHIFSNMHVAESRQSIVEHLQCRRRSIQPLVSTGTMLGQINISTSWSFLCSPANHCIFTQFLFQGHNGTASSTSATSVYSLCPDSPSLYVLIGQQSGTAGTAAISRAIFCCVQCSQQKDHT